jgi:channel protein (hemolysin III family)
MIFVVIAGTCTPFALIALRGALAGALLIAVWAGAAAGGLLYTAAPLSMPASARTPSGPSSATTRYSTPW